MAVSAGPDIVEDGLVFSIDAKNTFSYPTTGVTWSSLIGNLQVSLINGPTFNQSISEGIQFDGSNDYGTITSSLLNIGTGDFTLDIWYYWDNPQVGSYKKIMGSGAYLAAGYVIIGNDTQDKPLFGIQYGTTQWIGVGTVANGTPSPNSNNWNHGVVTRLNGIISVYLNGTFVQSRTDSYDFANATNVIRFGSNGNVGELFKGKIASVKQYNIGFTQNDVTKNFNAMRGRFGI